MTHVTITANNVSLGTSSQPPGYANVPIMIALIMFVSVLMAMCLIRTQGSARSIGMYVYREIVTEHVYNVRSSMRIRLITVVNVCHCFVINGSLLHKSMCNVGNASIISHLLMDFVRIQTV